MTGIGSIPRSYFDKRNSVDCDRATTPSNRSPYFRQRIRISLIADISSQLTPRVISDCSPSSMKFDSHRFLFRRDQIPSPYVLEIRSQANFTERKNYNERSHLCIIVRTSTSFFESSPAENLFASEANKTKKITFNTAYSASPIQFLRARSRAREARRHERENKFRAGRPFLRT